jgi:hypothetical protein
MPIGKAARGNGARRASASQFDDVVHRAAAVQRT